METPCKDCPDREVGCHGECEKYKAYAEACAKQREKRRDENELHEGLEERHRREKTRWMRKRRR